MGEVLMEEELVPRGFRWPGRKFQLIKWHKPKSGLKINTDASFDGIQATGGAIMRTDRGKLVFGIRFPLVASSSMEAELKAIIFATSWAIRARYENFQVESDSRNALSTLLDEDARRWRNEIQATRLSVVNKNISFRHVMREGNWTAHYLAKDKLGQLQIYFNPNDLPTLAKQAYLMDLFGIFSIRFL
ncbi:unnamed protein product [Cuscuta epithymum]|uniref:RNase H type-1 domain-containing protein n=1 Tax=Cuscuta epithymum TaxID=186058 RepID=A0AAV0G2B0_9ASTE|nr:unnamed protein product [Cuscuta epithymum]